MSSPQFALVPSSYPAADPLTFNVNNSTLLRKMFEPFAAAVETTNSPKWYGGCQLTDLLASSTDATSRDFLLWTANITTTQETTATGNITTTTTTITRANGSWITDGWQVGDIASIFTAVGVAAVAGTEGLLAAISAVTATVLTFTVVGGAWSAATAPAGCRVCKMHQRYRFTVPLNSGNAAAVANFSVLNGANDNSLLRTEMSLGATEMLVIQPVAAISALPASVSFKAQLKRY